MDLISTGTPMVAVGILESLDIQGWLFGPEVAAVIASLLSTIFGGFANAFIGNLFGGGA